MKNRRKEAEKVVIRGNFLPFPGLPFPVFPDGGGGMTAGAFGMRVWFIAPFKDISLPLPNPLELWPLVHIGIWTQGNGLTWCVDLDLSYQPCCISSCLSFISTPSLTWTWLTSFLPSSDKQFYLTPFLASSLPSPPFTFLLLSSSLLLL